jgi:hypothetical protein
MPSKITRSARPAPKPKGPVFPIRKPKLVTAADVPNVTPMNSAHVKAHYVNRTSFHAIVWGQYVAFSALLLTALWGAFLIHRTLALAEVGELTCSAENSYMWTMPTPDSDVPVLNDNVMRACAKAYRPFE